MICLIPARKGSKRIKNKNLTKISNKPLIAHVIEIVKKSKLFKKIIVSTDSKQIAKVAIKYGAEVPFIRKKSLSGDFVSTIDVIRDTIKNIKSYDTDYHFCVYPTSILTTHKDLKNGFRKIKKTKSDYLLTLKKYAHPPQRSIKIKNFKDYKYINEKNILKRTQDFESQYHDAGAFYIFKTDSIFHKKIKKKTYLILGRYSFFDIDNYEDLKFIKSLKS